MAPRTLGARGWTRSTISRWAAAVAGAGLVWVVAADGAPGWRLLRTSGVVLAATVVVRRPRTWSTALFGLVTTATGLGVGAPHATKLGATPMTVAGASCAAGGLVLLLVALADSVRSLRGWRRPAAAVALTLPTLVVLLSAVIAVAATNVPGTEVGARTPSELGLAYEDVHVRTADGVTLSGWYLPGATSAAVVLLHGSGSTRSSVLDQGAVLVRLGYGVLLVDARGHGRSGGRAMDLGWHGDLDVGGAVTFLTRRPEVDPGRIAVVGMSMGGEEAVGAAASDGRIRAVVAEGATGRVAADHAWLSDRYGVRGAAQEWISRLTYGLADLLTSASPPGSLRAAVRAMASRPVLLITAGDVEDERLAADWIRGGAPASVAIWEVPGAGHTDGLAVRPDEWERRVGAFLARALRR